MPRTIDQGFRELLQLLTPSVTETAAAKSHRASIEACLRNNFGITRFARIGSFGNGTSISGFSDVDYLACVPRDLLLANSSRSLTLVRNALDARFPATGVRVNCPAVRVPFGSSPSEVTEVVPADLVGTDRGFAVYDIADCREGWMRSSPDFHNAYVRAVDDKLGGKVKPLIRLLKAWKFQRNVPISSFYLELRTAVFASSQSVIYFEHDVYAMLIELGSDQLAPMVDPLRISEPVPACKSEGEQADALSKLSTALTRAQKAREAEDKSDLYNAFEWWNQLFGGGFPPYYF